VSSPSGPDRAFVRHASGARHHCRPRARSRLARIVKTIAVYDDFCHANDPYGEHDFGSFEADGQRIFFKIDYLDKVLTYHSPDPSDPSVTERVIAIMLAEEY
jgi:hypothetical protein